MRWEERERSRREDEKGKQGMEGGEGEWSPFVKSYK